MMSTAVRETTNEQPHVSGVQELINRIRTEGVSKGQEESDRLVADARQASMLLLDDAKRKADQILVTAHNEAEHLRKNGEDALRLAARDAVLALSESLRSDFAAKVRRLVSQTMRDRSFLERLILEIGRRAIPYDSGKSLEVLLPADVVTYEELKRNPQELAENELSRFVLELSGNILREGLTFAPAEDERPGLRIKLKDEDVEIDLTDQAVTDLLMEHLSPRFRALMDRPQS